MPRYRLSIDVPQWLDKLIVWPVLVWRWLWYDYTFRRVKLLPDRYAKVDPADFDEVSQHIWWAKKTPRSYTAVRFVPKGRVLISVYMHREIMFGTNPKSETINAKQALNPNGQNSKESGEDTKLFVDHRDGDGLNNLRSNLRLATASQNSMNRRKCRGTTSKYKGVCWNRSRRLWQSTIQIEKKNVHLGYFDSEIEAAKAYDEAARKYHGEFAYLNFSDGNKLLTRRAGIRNIIGKIIHELTRIYLNIFNRRYLWHRLTQILIQAKGAKRKVARGIWYCSIRRMMADNNQIRQETSGRTRNLARIVLVTFLLTFMLARVVVFLIMSRTIPDLYLHLKGNHIHHLNYGIFLLSAVGAYLIFRRPEGKKLSIWAGIYGVAMALTFDEFGMWIHLGGGYWQRASWDAVVVLSALFGLIAFAPALKRFRPHHWVTSIILIITLFTFLLLFFESFRYAGKKLGPKLHHMESTAPE